MDTNEVENGGTQPSVVEKRPKVVICVEEWLPDLMMDIQEPVQIVLCSVSRIDLAPVVAQSDLRCRTCSGPIRFELVLGEIEDWRDVCEVIELLFLANVAEGLEALGPQFSFAGKRSRRIRSLAYGWAIDNKLQGCDRLDKLLTRWSNVPALTAGDVVIVLEGGRKGNPRGSAKVMFVQPIGGVDTQSLLSDLGLK